MSETATATPSSPAIPEPPGSVPGADPASPARRWPRPLPLWLEGLLVYLLGQALTFWYIPALRDRNQTLFQDVTVNAMGPDRHGMSRLWHQGVFPTWVRDSYGGEPYLANIQHGVLYPGNLPFWFLKTATALDVVVAVHLAVAFVGMWAYCRLGLRTGPWAALLGAFAFGFGGNVLAHVTLGDQMQATCLVPVVMLAAHLALERGRLRWTVVAALAIGLQFLAGHPEEWLYTVAGVAGYGLFWALLRERRGQLRRAWLAIVRLGGAVALFVLLFSWQLLPTLLLKSQGYRNGSGFSEQHPLPADNGLNTLLPDFGQVLTGENVTFVGTAALCLVGLAIVARRRDLEWVRAWILVAGGLAFVMALGLHTGFYRFLYDHVSLIKSFRVPSRYLLVTSFALAAGAAIGLDELLRTGVGVLRVRLGQGLAAVGVLAVGVLAVLGVSGGVNDGVSWKRWGVAGVVGLTAWVAASWRPVPRAPVAIILIALTAFELQTARSHAEYRQKAPDALYNSYGPVLGDIAAGGGRYVSIATPRGETAAQRAEIPVPAGLPGGSSGLAADYYRAGWTTRIAATPTTQYAVGAENIVGRDGGFLPLGRYREYYGAVVRGGGDLNAGTPTALPSAWNWSALDLAGVRWFVTDDTLPASQRAVLASHGFTPTLHYAYVELWKRPVLPTARLVHTVDVVPDETARLARLAAPGYSLTSRATVEQPVTLDPAPTTADAVSTTHLGGTTVDLTTTSSARSLLVLPDPYYPQWQVTVDGKRASLLAVDEAFQGVVVPAGTHTVRFAYVDTRLRIGVGMAGVTLIGLFGVTALAPLVRRRRRSGEPDPDSDSEQPGPDPAPDDAPIPTLGVPDQSSEV